MASVIRSRLLLILAIMSLAISVPAAALADCTGDGGGGGWVWEPPPPTGGGGGSTGGGSTGGGGTGTVDAPRCSSLSLPHLGPEENCGAWEGGPISWASWQSPGSPESFEAASREEMLRHNPILFVHGFSGSQNTWTKMIERFRNFGWSSNRLFNWSYNSSQSNVVTASEIASKVNTLRMRTLASKVDIITHSMGGLSSRYYIKRLGGLNYVDDWVSLGGPNHGTKIAYWCRNNHVSCQQMYPGSTFLTELNEGDETPGAVNYLAYRSSCDGIIIPSSSTYLWGATNKPTSDPNAATTPCPFHWNLHQNEDIFFDVLYFVQY